MTIAKRAYRHLQNHPYCLLFMLIFYLVYFILAFVVALLAKQFSDSSVQLSKIIASLDSQHTSLYEPFKVLESITTHYTMEYQHLLLLIVFAGTLSMVVIQLFLSRFRKKEYQTYLLMGERVYKLTTQLIVEQLFLINTIILVLLFIYSLFTTPVMNKISHLESEILQQELKPSASLVHLQRNSPLSSSENGDLTRFNINAFLMGESIHNTFTQNNTLQAFFLVGIINFYSFIVIGIPNYLLLSLKKNTLS
ncbi:hypothetical protein LHA31_10885 [Carnobacterium viridans]|uniref:FtsX-like permease family protein n=1 Tax=Carnobacterium viridans TaxID=174587 RepID=A0A1H0YMY3_9LACT|nr:hypothetical protein [Carnobacterium viridans]UDE95041.1 hypothetical protein LHA31_10885 [Carnobacterium viridans]SDQ16534.1 hypothetical protein SAMN04487752_1051 [Carnobacterium viridans]